MPATPSTADSAVTAAEAAVILGLSERTVLRRLKQGKLQGYKVDAGRGTVWRVLLDGMATTPPTGDDAMAVMRATPTGTADGMPSAPPALAEFAHAVIDELRQEYREELERLRRENQQLAGQVGFLQARVQDQERQIALLMAPKEPEEARPEPEPAPKDAPGTVKAPWWRRVFG